MHMKHVCRKCSTTFSSLDILDDHVERCIKQKPTSFSWKNLLMFEDYRMKGPPVPFRVLSDFECFNQPTFVADNHYILYEKIPIAVGYCVVSTSRKEKTNEFGEN